MEFRNISIAKKIQIIVLIFLILPITSSLMSLKFTSDIHGSGEEIYKNYLVSIVNLTNARKDLYQEFVWIKSHIVAPDDNAMHEAERNIATSVTDFNRNIGKFKETLDAGEETRLFNAFMQDIARLHAIKDRILELSRNNNDEEADRIAKGEYNDTFMNAQRKLSQMFDTNTQGADSSFLQSETQHGLVESMIYASLLIFSIIGITTGLVLVRSIKAPILNTKNGIVEINSSNDLSKPLPEQGNDEIADLCHSFNNMMGSLKDVIRKVNTSTAVLGDQSTELKHTTQQVESDLETSSTLLNKVQLSTEEINQAIDEIAQSASSASEEASKSNEFVTEGLNIQTRTIDSAQSLQQNMATASESVSGLYKETEAIGSVLDVIKGIAEQTNLLALNAAIEAARAGEQGRGFAVVADEVRTLAQRTQTSTSEIESMIDRLQSGSQASVNAMTECTNSLETTINLTSDSEQALKLIAESAHTIAQLNIQIAAATEEQSAVVRDIAENISIANDRSQTSIASFSGLQSISTGLTEVIKDFEPLVKRFKL